MIWELLCTSGSTDVSAYQELRAFGPGFERLFYDFCFCFALAGRHFFLDYHIPTIFIDFGFCLLNVLLHGFSFRFPNPFLWRRGDFRVFVFLLSFFVLDFGFCGSGSTGAFLGGGDGCDDLGSGWLGRVWGGFFGHCLGGV